MYFYIVFYYFDFVWSLICNIHVISFVLCVVFGFAFIYVLFGKILFVYLYIFQRGLRYFVLCKGGEFYCANFGLLDGMCVVYCSGFYKFR